MTLDLLGTKIVAAHDVGEELHDGGRLIIPVFAVGRTQSVVLFLGQLMRDGALPKLDIHVESPMSREATRIMGKHPGLFDAETSALLRYQERKSVFVRSCQ